MDRRGQVAGSAPRGDGSVAVSDDERGARPRSALFGDSALIDRRGGGGGDPSVTSGASTRAPRARRLGRLPGLRPVRPLRSALSFAATLSKRRSTDASRAFSVVRRRPPRRLRL